MSYLSTRSIFYIDIEGKLQNPQFMWAKFATGVCDTNYVTTGIVDATKLDLMALVMSGLPSIDNLCDRTLRYIKNSPTAISSLGVPYGRIIKCIEDNNYIIILIDNRMQNYKFLDKIVPSELKKYIDTLPEIIGT